MAVWLLQCIKRGFIDANIYGMDQAGDGYIFKKRGRLYQTIPNTNTPGVRCVYGLFVNGIAMVIRLCIKRTRDSTAAFIWRAVILYGYVH